MSATIQYLLQKFNKLSRRLKLEMKKQNLFYLLALGLLAMVLAACQGNMMVPVQAPAGQPAEAAADQPAEEAAEQPAEAAADQPAEEAVEQPAEAAAEQPAEEATEAESEAAGGRSRLRGSVVDEVQPVSGCDPLSGVLPEVAEFFNRANQYRAAQALPCLQMSEKLNQAAQTQVNYLAQNNLLTHEGKDASGQLTTICDRQFDVGYYGASANENALQGGATPAEALESWKQSRGHNETLTDQKAPYRFTGVAVATSSNGTKYWVQTFNEQPENGLPQARMAKTCMLANPNRAVYAQFKENSPEDCRPERAKSSPPAEDGFSICAEIAFDDGGWYKGTIIDYENGTYKIASTDNLGPFTLQLGKNKMKSLAQAQQEGITFQN
jgi:uncharacterized protein YkwD